MCENAEYKFNVDKAITITAKWSVNTVSYKIEYYLQNLANDSYTLTETTTDSGLTDTTATIEPKDITHFTFNEGYSLNVLESNINGNETTVLKIYYKRNKYDITVVNDNNKAGSVTGSGTYKYEKEITVKATTNIGYIFLGWYSGEELLSTDLTYTFIVDKNITAKFKVKEEMANFNFTSTTTSCQITGIKNKTVTKIIVPNYVTSISSGAFRDSSSLTSVVIGDSVTSIGDRAFSVCSSLTSVVIGDSVTSIGEWAFYDCSKLTSVVIGDSVTSIGEAAFFYCGSLTSVNYTGTIDQWAQIAFGDYAANPLLYAKKLYINGELVTQANITTATKINSCAFYNCDSLTSITIPNSVTSIDPYAFYDCDSLTSVVIGDSVTSIGDYAFFGCSKLTSVVIGDSVTSIGFYAFNSCSSLTSVTFEDTSTWYRTMSRSDWQNKTGGTATSVTTPTTNDDYLKSKYEVYYWYKK